MNLKSRRNPIKKVEARYLIVRLSPKLDSNDINPIN